MKAQVTCCLSFIHLAKLQTSKRTVTATAVLEAVDRLLMDDDAKSRVTEFQKILQQWDGHSNAAEFLREIRSFDDMKRSKMNDCGMFQVKVALVGALLLSLCVSANAQSFRAAGGIQCLGKGPLCAWTSQAECARL